MPSDFTQLTELAATWQAQLPLTAESNDRLWKKLRLEWNYHSNHIEGNTLTYGETEMLLLHDRTTGNHTHREYLEMKAHNVGIDHVRSLASDLSRPLTEADIRDLNRIILKEPFWKPASTADGHPTRKEIIPGQYKTSPNSVRTATGEMFYYASVEDTPPRMAALASWLQQELAAPTIHPVELAARLHYDFVRIHPFNDGNGRVARLLVNYVLMRAGYLPVIVRTEDKKNYLTVLQLADAGDIGPLIEYFSNLAYWSLKLGLKAAKGEPVDEPSDVEKEIALFVRSQQAEKKAEAVTKEVFQQVFAESLRPLLEKAETKFAQLKPLFKRTEVRSRFVGHGETITGPNINFPPLRYMAHGESCFVSFMFYNYQGEAPAPFDFEFVIEIHFPPDRYTIATGAAIIVSNPYSKLILSDESDQLVSEMLAKAFRAIKLKAARK